MSKTDQETGKQDHAMREPKTFVLPKSKITMVYEADPSVSQVIAAQKASSKDTSLFVLYLAQATATFDGVRWTMGDIREKIRGKDYLAMAAEMLADKDEADGPLAV